MIADDFLKYIEQHPGNNVETAITVFEAIETDTCHQDENGDNYFTLHFPDGSNIDNISKTIHLGFVNHL